MKRNTLVFASALCGIVFSLFAQPVQASRVLIDFGRNDGGNGSETVSPDTNGNYWNNLSGDFQIADNVGLADLVDVDNASTGVSINTFGIAGQNFRANGRNNGGLLTPDPALLGDFAIGTATEDYFFVEGTANTSAANDPSGITFSGLDPDAVYDFRLFGSRATTSTRETRFSAIGENIQYVTMLSSGVDIGADGYDGNNNNIVSLTGITPDANNEIQLLVSVVQGNFAYLNVLEVTATTNQVPEPSTVALLGLAAVGLVMVRGAKRWQSALAIALAAVASLTMANNAEAQPYQNEVNRWNTQDALDPLPQDSIVFVGSSSIRRWEQLTRDFADYNVIQRGIGGALFDDVNAQVGDLVNKHSPRAVVVWAGTNDLGSGSNGLEVLDDYLGFVNSVHTVDPTVDIFYLGIMPTPGREGNRPQEDIANGLISNYASSHDHAYYIDLPAEFDALGAYTGSDFQNKFVDDIHLNRDGYDLWTSIVRPQIEAVAAPDKVYAPNTALSVGDKILFDFGANDTTNGEHTASPDVNGNHWNNWHPLNGGTDILPGEHIGNLVNTAGENVGLGLTITAQFHNNGKNHGGLFSPDPALLGDLAVESATVDYFFSTGDGVQGGGNDDMAGGFMITGLDTDYVYDFRLFGTRATTDVRKTEYRLIGATEHSAILQTSGTDIGFDGMYDGNDDEVIEFLSVKPDEFGQIFFDQTLIEGSFAYIGAMEITVSPGDTGVPEPSTMVLGAMGAIALIGIRKLRR
ncbi:GDSL-type esterase/lipase family protein [Aeoliella mucimassa]|uniref:PEP-CTERM motif protein n=1 Tax=Aeoliella mucimassa TaxID=2527972 RepID=A0A518AWP7_9BACT|nr:GDSL-type esterase/lipase family protein [Aeoliella mucimassa]QDU59121.1 PEP-CTERM motif protein [Aeoliella mucimassa]